MHKNAFRCVGFQIFFIFVTAAPHFTLPKSVIEFSRETEHNLIHKEREKDLL